MSEGFKFDLSGFLPGPINTKRFRTIPISYLCSKLAKGKVVQGETEGPIIEFPVHTQHALLQTLEVAFNNHVPVILTPDDFLLPLVQASAVFAKSQADPNGPKLILKVDKTCKSWPETFVAFREQIRMHVGEKADTFQARFSTTGHIQAVAYDVALMDAYQNHFKYETFSFCGIPSITLLGTKEDWKLFVEKVDKLLEYFPEIETWKDELRDTVAKIYASVLDNNKDLWLSIYKYNQASGTDTLTGWINLFFPVNGKDMTIATKMEDIVGRGKWGRAMNTYPGSIASAPTTHTDELGIKHSYRYYAGQIGFTQIADLSIVPCWAWVVMEE